MALRCLVTLGANVHGSTRRQSETSLEKLAEGTDGAEHFEHTLTAVYRCSFENKKSGKNLKSDRKTSENFIKP